MTSSSDFSSWYTSSTCSICPPLCYCSPRFQTSYPFSAHLLSSPSASSPPSHALGCFSTLPATSFPPDSFRVLQWNASGLQARSTELLHIFSSHPVDLICIRESTLNLSSSIRIPGFSALQSDCTHSRCGIFSIDIIRARGGVIIFVRQGLSFPELSTSSLFLLDPYSDYVEVNFSLNDFSSLSFLNAYALPICSSPTDGKTDSFFPPSFPPPEISSFWELRLSLPPLGL